MSSTKSHRKKVLTKVIASHSETGFIACSSQNKISDEKFDFSGRLVVRAYGAIGYSKLESDFNLQLDSNISNCDRVLLIQTKPLVGYTTAHLKSPNLQSWDVKVRAFASSEVYIKPFSSNVIQTNRHSKSVFEMSPNEFNKNVSSRSIHLANERWNRGLPLSVPAGKEYAANQFIHIYKDQSTQLVELDEASGEVNLVQKAF